MLPLTYALHLLSLAGVSQALAIRQQDLPEADLLTRDITEQPTHVFRGDGRNPDKVRAAGGFLPHSDFPPRTLKAYGLYNHVVDTIVDANTKKRDTLYVSTTPGFSTAVNFAADRPLGGFVYRIHATPNMIDVKGSLLSHNPFPGEHEWAALGGVRWDQIEGWMFIPENYTNVNWRQPGAPTFESESYRYKTNPDYKAKYNPLKASEGQPQLVGFYGDAAAWANLNPWKKFKPTKTKTLLTYAEEFMKKNGAAVGWKGKFPLFGDSAKRRSLPVLSVPTWTQDLPPVLEDGAAF